MSVPVLAGATPADRLFELLPAIYRWRDAEQHGPLQELLRVVGEQVALVEDDVRRLYDNWFIETCEEWVVPYLADLVGYESVAGALLGATADGRRLTLGLHNVPSLGLFVWRLGSYPITRGLAYAREADGDGLYNFSVLGNDIPLFIRPVQEADPTDIAGEPILPVPLRRRTLRDAVGTYYGDGRTLCIWKGREDETGPTADNAVSPEAIRVADLTGWYYDPEPGTVVVDPVLGRFAFPENELPEGDVWVSYGYGFSADMGGGEYRRAVTAPSGAKLYHVPAEAPTIGDALARWIRERRDVPHAVVEIGDSGFYSEPIELDLEPGESLQIRAASGVRPVLSLLERRPARSDPLSVRGARGARFGLDGLLVVGRGLRLAGPFDCVTIRHTTLVPGWDVSCNCEPCNPNEPSITLRAFHGRLTVDRSIVGGILVDADEVRTEPVDIRLLHSIIDATNLTHPAIGTQRAGIAHVSLTVRCCTLVGTVWCHAIALAENSIFLGDVGVARSQIGCMRYCSVPVGARTPRRHRCQPDLAAAVPGVDPALARLRVVPQFTSLLYGTPGYAQLADGCAEETTRGADDESEMGTFHDLFQPQREALLHARLAEFVPAGTNPRLFHAT
jgi:hypothetical protein